MAWRPTGGVCGCRGSAASRSTGRPGTGTSATWPRPSTAGPPSLPSTDGPGASVVYSTTTNSTTSAILNIYSIQTKVPVYQTLVLSILLYASETWTSLASDMKVIKSFHMKYQRRIFGIRWQDFVRNSEVSLRTGLAPVSDRITRGHTPTTSPTHSSASIGSGLRRECGSRRPCSCTRPLMELRRHT